MVIRQRAIQAEDKQERHHAILDAAERLLARSPDRIANMADVADEAGLAKGTVYLYFPSKEELLLAVHERNIDGFFRALIARARRATSRSTHRRTILALTHDAHGRAAAVPAARRALLRPHGAERPARDRRIAFKQRMAERLDARRRRASSGISRSCAPARGVALLRHSYALILGLWQMSGESAGRASAPDGDGGMPASFARLSRRARPRAARVVERHDRPRRRRRPTERPS